MNPVFAPDNHVATKSPTFMSVTSLLLALNILSVALPNL